MINNTVLEIGLALVFVAGGSFFPYAALRSLVASSFEPGSPRPPFGLFAEAMGYSFAIASATVACIFPLTLLTPNLFPVVILCVAFTGWLGWLELAVGWLPKGAKAPFKLPEFPIQKSPGKMQFNLTDLLAASFFFGLILAGFIYITGGKRLDANAIPFIAYLLTAQGRSRKNSNRDKQKEGE